MLYRGGAKAVHGSVQKENIELNL